MPEARVRLSFYTMFADKSTLTSWVCSYIRVTEGKIVFQTALDYKMHSFALTRIHDVEIRPC